MRLNPLMIALASLSFATAANALAQAPAACDKTCEKRRAEFRYVVYVGKQIYCYWPEKKAETGTDFDALARTLEQRITSDTSYSEYYKILRNWASAFNDGHVNVMTKPDVTELEIYTAPIRVEVMAPATDHEKVIVVQVDAGAEGVAVGDQITQIDGVPIAEALTKAAAESSSGSTERMRRFWAGRRLVDVIGGDVGKPLALNLVTPAGAQKKVTLPRNVQLDVKPDSAAAAVSTGKDLFTAKVLNGGWGYFRLDGFSGSQDEALISQAMNRLQNTRGLILDLRKNGGGDLSGDRIIERLIDQPVIRYKRSERLSDFILSQRGADIYNLTPDPTGIFSIWHDLNVEPLKGKRYKGPVVALISPHCFSACDTFVSSLKANKLATIIGEPSGGGTGTPLVFDLPHSPLQFRYSVIRGQDPDGKLIEGMSTTPDPGMYLEPTIDDRITPTRDSQLARAIQVLASRAAPESPGVITLPVLAERELLAPTWVQSLHVSPTIEEQEARRRFNERD